MILITHDFGAIAEMADRVVVMYAGHKIEEGPVRDIVTDPRHPYTQGLLRCVPELDDGARIERGALPEIGGTVPSLASPPPGCPFAPRATGNIATEDANYLLTRQGMATGLSHDRLAAQIDWLDQRVPGRVTGQMSRAGWFGAAEGAA